MTIQQLLRKKKAIIGEKVLVPIVKNARKLVLSEKKCHFFKKVDKIWLQNFFSRSILVKEIIVNEC